VDEEPQLCFYRRDASRIADMMTTNSKMLKEKGCADKVGTLGFCWGAMMTLKQGADPSYGKRRLLSCKASVCARALM
jgi:dienelactone hydrolase